MHEKLKVMIVDDEILAIHSVKKMIQWEEHGYELIGEFTSAKKAMAFFMEKSPHIVLLDIRMPGMDGLEFSETILTGHRNTKIIFLTAYKDFDYAKKAVELGISSYILKHELCPEILISQLNKLREDIQRQIQISDVIRKQELLSLLEGKTGMAQNMDELKYCKSTKDTHFVLFLLVKDEPFDFFRARYNLPLNPFLDFSDHACRDFPEGIEGIDQVAVDKNQWAFLFKLVKPISQKYIIDSVHTTAVKIQKKFKADFAATLSVISSAPFKNIQEIHKIFTRLKQFRAGLIFLGREKIVNADDFKADPACDGPNSKPDILPLLNALESMDTESISGCVHVLFSPFLTGGGFNVEKFRDLCMSLAGILDVYRNEHRLRLLEEFIKEQDEEINMWYSVGDISKWFVRHFYRSMEEVGKASEARYSKKVLGVMSYIHENYAKDLSIDEIAEKSGISGHYLRHIFKEEAGVTILDFITETRVEKSKKLLKNGRYKIYEVADKVGYSSSQYFSQVFKRMTGFTPQEFIERGGPA